MTALADYRPEIVERVLAISSALGDLLEQIDEDEDPGQHERDVQARRRVAEWYGTPRPEWHPVTSPVALSDFAPVTEWQRAIAARAGVTESTVRDRVSNGPAFEHWRKLHSRLGIEGSVAGYRPMLKLLAQPWTSSGNGPCVAPIGTTYTVRYAAIMAGEVGAAIRIS